MHAIVLMQIAELLAARTDLVDAATVVPNLQVDLRYATADNFLGAPVYGDLATCYLAKDAAAMLARAGSELAAHHPELRLHVWDCARPAVIQRRMWAVVVGTPAERYVADPKKGSIHSFGCAVDITLAGTDGTPLDMGTPHDYFGRRAQPDVELELRQRGELSAAQLANRLVLREVMVRAGFQPLSVEWWHFDCATQSDTRRRFRIIE